ncbi:hypothetical protein GCM10023169_17000 [Georgenia halophila]|uniref:Lipoprotein n=1 Tax=Georgenia halophila TaxID=620889 RepID=A0ABP8L6G7_9MICO
MHRRDRRGWAAAATASAVVVLVGCSPSGPTYSGLDTERTPEDELPPSIETNSFRSETSRLVHQDEDYAYYLASPTNDPAEGRSDNICVVQAPLDDDRTWTSSCARTWATVGNGTQSVTAVPDGADVSRWIDRGWEQIHENLLIPRPSDQ